MSKPHYRFAFDLGTNSIGWAVYSLTGPSDRSPSVASLEASGVRLFDDSRNPKDKKSLAEKRRVPRSARRRRDRFLMRRKELINVLIRFGLFPNDDRQRRSLAAEFDPYYLRAKALDHVLTPFELGRALFHLNQRRGFKSNRKADRKLDEKGKINAASARLQEKLKSSDVRTFGEFLWRRHGGDDLNNPLPVRQRKAVRIRLDGEGAKAMYDYYPLREMLEDEFDQIIASQKPHHPDILSDGVIECLRSVIFYQRPLKPVKRGRCTLEPEEERLYKALPSVEARTIYETLNALRYGNGLELSSRLTRAERNEVAQQLLQGKNVTFKTKLRAITRAGSDVRFSLEAQGKKDLSDFVSKSAKAMSKPEMFGKAWHSLSLEQKDAIVQLLLEEEKNEVVVKTLIESYGLDADAARNAANWVPPEGTARLGPTANAAVLRELIGEADQDDDYLLVYSAAVERAGKRLGKPWHHSDFRDGEIRVPLPYYGEILERQVIFGSGKPEDSDEDRFGKFPNPTVHRALNQLRRLVNELIKAFNEPQQIVIEVARDLKLSKRQKDDIQRQQNQNRQDNDRRRQELEKLKQSDSYENRLRLRLFEEQQRANGGTAICPYSLKPISLENLFSSDIDIDHILPYSRTLDDSPANKIICYRSANRDKRNRSPYEHLNLQPAWQDIQAAAKGLSNNKNWRFAENAMERFETSERNFLARQIHETRHLSRMARAYLGAVAGYDNVYVTTGQLTALLRAQWGLNNLLGGENRKQRDDHRHHAIDAIVVGALDRGLLQEMAKRAEIAEIEGRSRITADVPEPVKKFRDVVRAQLDNLVVSVKPEHGKGGALHEETAYGVVAGEAEQEEIGNLVFRKPVTGLTVGEIDRVRDPVLRQELRTLASPFRNEKGKCTDPKGLASALDAFSRQKAPGRKQGVRRVRIGKKEASTVAIKNRRNGRIYKALVPGDNHHIDIVQMRDGSWQGFAATVFDVNQKDWRPEWERNKLGGKLVMRLHKGDTIEVDHEGQRKIMVVHRLSPSNNILYLAAHNEGGELAKRHADSDDLFRWDFANIGGLKSRSARRVRVDSMGRVNKPKANIDG